MLQEHTGAKVIDRTIYMTDLPTRWDFLQDRMEIVMECPATMTQDTVARW